MSYHVIEQVGDATFQMSAHTTLERAMLVAIDLHVASDEERELFVDGPGMACPVSVGHQQPTSD
jgi:hypothetical protein